jgi:hypothetical protein
MLSSTLETSEWYIEQLFPIQVDALALQMWTEHCAEYKLKHAVYSAQGILLDFNQIKISASVYSIVYKRYEPHDTIIIPVDLDRAAPYIKAAMLRLAEKKLARDEEVDRHNRVLCAARDIFYGYHSEILK